MDEATLKLLVQRADANDAGALADLYREFRPRVFGLCRYMLGSREEAEDATSEIFARLERAMKSYDASLPFPRLPRVSTPAALHSAPPPSSVGRPRSVIMFVFPSMLSPTNQRRRSRWITAPSSFSSHPVLRMAPTFRSCGSKPAKPCRRRLKHWASGTVFPWCSGTTTT